MTRFKLKPNQPQEAKVVVGIYDGKVFIYGVYVDEEEAEEQKVILAENVVKKHRQAREGMKKIIKPLREPLEEEMVALDNRLRENYKVITVELGVPIEVEVFEVL